MTSKFKKGDHVRLTDGRDPGKTSLVRSESRGGVALEERLGGYYTWNEGDLELVPQSIADDEAADECDNAAEYWKRMYERREAEAQHLSNELSSLRYKLQELIDRR